MSLLLEPAGKNVNFVLVKMGVMMKGFGDDNEGGEDSDSDEMTMRVIMTVMMMTMRMASIENSGLVAGINLS